MNKFWYTGELIGCRIWVDHDDPGEVYKRLLQSNLPGHRSPRKGCSPVLVCGVNLNILVPEYEFHHSSLSGHRSLRKRGFAIIVADVDIDLFGSKQ